MISSLQFCTSPNTFWETSFLLLQACQRTVLQTHKSLTAHPSLTIVTHPVLLFCIPPEKQTTKKSPKLFTGSAVKPHTNDLKHQVICMHWLLVSCWHMAGDGHQSKASHQVKLDSWGWAAILILECTFHVITASLMVTILDKAIPLTSAVNLFLLG